MKKLLWIDHAFHNKTKSSAFMFDLFCNKYDITRVDIDPYSKEIIGFKALKHNIFDAVVLWQMQPSIQELRRYIKFKYIMFFPMYDDSIARDLNSPIWSEYRDVNIINFSKALHNKCLEYGLSSYYFQYFPEPKHVDNWGDDKSVFLWQRRPEIDLNTVDKTLGFDNFNTICLHRVPDPEVVLPPVPDKLKNKIKISTWFDTKKEMNDYLQQSAIYYAPRVYEGIGMSFLDAMAIGRCTVAPDNPTMNEYIIDGYNGFLYDLKKTKHIQINDLRKIQKNAYKYIVDGYKQWEKSKFEILSILETVPNNKPCVMDKKLYVSKPKYIHLDIRLAKIIKTSKYRILYLFGVLPIKIKRHKNNSK